MAKTAELPMDKGRWKECRIIEDRGEHDEHDDQFYRYEDFGIEACRHGMPNRDPEYETYVIVGDVPYRVEGFYSSFEEAVGALVHASQAKRVDGGKWDEEDGGPDEDKGVRKGKMEPFDGGFATMTIDVEDDKGKDDEDEDEDDDEDLGPFDGGADVVYVRHVDFEDIAKSSVSDIIAHNREDRKAPKKVSLEKDGPCVADSEMRTARFPGRTVRIGEGKDPALPKDIRVRSGAEGASRRKA